MACAKQAHPFKTTSVNYMAYCLSWIEIPTMMKKNSSINLEAKLHHRRLYKSKHCRQDSWISHKCSWAFTTWFANTTFVSRDFSQEVLKPILLRRMKEDVETLPEKEEIIVEVELTHEQRRYYKAIYSQQVNWGPLVDTKCCVFYLTNPA